MRVGVRMRGPILGLAESLEKVPLPRFRNRLGRVRWLLANRSEVAITVQIAPGRAVTLAGMGNPGRAGGVSESNLSGCERRQQAERKQSCRQRRCVDLLPPHCYFSRTRTLQPLWT